VPKNALNVIFRDARLEDAEAAATIHVKTWQIAYRGQIPNDYLDSLDVVSRTKRWQEKLSNPSPRTRNLIAEANQKIIGFCDIGKSRDEDATDDVGEVLAIYIDTDFMGKGVGTKLIDKALESLKDFVFKSATLWVLEINTIGRRFYEKNGWTTEGTTKSEGSCWIPGS
jgi:ribosomal protein S18 acetylase RimI-like enzyme